LLTFLSIEWPNSDSALVFCDFAETKKMFNDIYT